MPLTNGTALGPYEIVAPLGAGGMGEVYRARDTRLDRTVAIKVIPESLAADAALRARFEREARAISGLTHPHICALYDLGHQNGTDYLVMEYLEGESLADRLARGPLPVSQVLRYGAEIAQALHHAHRRGITHRDLKPGNVMLTASGAKLLDFGLAKLAAQPREIGHDAPTAVDANPITTEGTILGTLPYMSPEQIEGKELDTRSDIFSLGVMLYEMVTGHRPFQGASSAALAASILSTDPPSQPLLPPALDRVVRTALEKDPDQRFQSAHDLARQLRWISEPSSPAQAAVVTPRALPRIWQEIALGIAIVAIAWAAARWTRPTETNAIRLSLALPDNVELFHTAETIPFAISPDGKTIALTAFDRGKRFLFLRSLDSDELRKIDGTDGAMVPFWSPDGEWIGYSTRTKLWKVKRSGGPPQPVCDTPTGAAGTWHGETILFADVPPGGRAGIFRVPSSGGTATAVTKLNAAEGERLHVFPRFLAVGRHFLYMSNLDAAAERRLMLGSLDSPARTRIATGVSAAVPVGDRLVYVRDGKLFAQTFDPAKGLTGDPKTIADDVSYFYMTGRGEFDASPNGALVYTTRTDSGRLVVANRSGAEVRVITADGLAPTHADVAGDGRRALVTMRTRATGLMDIWLYDLARGVGDRITTDPGVETHPAWSPDGRSIIYSHALGNPPRLVQRTLSSGTSTPVGGPGASQWMGSFAPDGKSLYYQTREGRSMGIVRMMLDGSKKTEVLIDDPSFWEQDPQVSPDGRWLAFASEMSGALEVYVQDLASGERVRISYRGGRFPRWRGDGGELFYVTLDQTVVGATPRNGSWDDAQLTELFRARNTIEGFDPLPDGQSFLLAESIPSPADSLIHVATGW